MLNDPANADSSILRIRLSFSRIKVKFCSPEKLNFSSLFSDVFCIDSLRNLGNPLKANRPIRVILLLSRYNSPRFFSSTNASDLIMAKLFFDNVNESINGENFHKD